MSKYYSTPDSIPLIQSQMEVEIEIIDGSIIIRQFDSNCENESEIYLKDLNTLSEFIEQLTSVNKYINGGKK